MNEQQSKFSKLSVSLFMVITLFAVLCLTLFASWLTKGCLILDCPPQRNFTAYDMNIPKGYLPNKKFIKLRPDRGLYGATQQTHGGVTWGNGQATYIVDKFGTVKKADDWFNFSIRQNMFTSNLPSPEPHQAILNHLMKNADRYKVKCGYILADFCCTFDARYEEFYVYFSGSVGIHKMTDQNFTDLMDYIDTKLDNFLKPEK